ALFDSSISHVELGPVLDRRRRARMGTARAGRRLAGASARYRAERRPEAVVLAPVSAVVGRRAQASLDLPAARHGDRRVAAGRLGVSGWHASVEGVLARRSG